MKGMSTKGIHDGIFKILVEGSCSYSTVNKLVADFKRGKVSLTEIHDQVSKNLRLQTIRPQGYIFSMLSSTGQEILTVNSNWIYIFVLL